MAGSSPFHGMPLDDLGHDGRGPDGLRVVPTSAEVASTARFQGLDMVPTADKARIVVPGAAPGTGAMPMHDPQQPDLAEQAADAANARMGAAGYDPYEGFAAAGGMDGISSVTTPSGQRMLAMVEPAVLTSFERPPTIIRSSQRVGPEEEARRLVAEARDAARAMLAQAKDVIAAERDQAVRDGRAEGHAQGMADADVETAGLIATCERIGVHVMEERERVLGQQEADTVELAIAIAQRIVGAALDVTPDLVVEACRGAMRKAFQRESMQVLAHPEDLAVLRDAGPQLAAELGGVEHLDFLEERRLDRGSIIVRTPAGEIDATIAGKSQRIEAALREGIEARRAERRATGA